MSMNMIVMFLLLLLDKMFYYELLLWMFLILGVFLSCLGSVGLVEEVNYLFDYVSLVDLCVLNSYNYNFLLEILFLFYLSMCFKDL